jgi:hypothetical protein
MSGAGAGGQGGNCPTQNLVEAYEDGDLRLAATVAKNGDSWPNANTQPLETFIGGVNGLPNVNATPTGYYLKKYVDGTTQIAGNGENSFYHVWVTFRLAEFYLNYAECLLNLKDKSGFTMTAAQAINTVRKRAGLADLTDAEATLDACKKERFVELAFEGHRFNDLRRWLLLDKAPYNVKTSQEFTRAGEFDPKNPKDNQVSGWEEKTILTRNFTQKHWWLPLKKKDTSLYPDMFQNPGW